MSSFLSTLIFGSGSQSSQPQNIPQHQQLSRNRSQSGASSPLSSTPPSFTTIMLASSPVKSAMMMNIHFPPNPSNTTVSSSSSSGSTGGIGTGSSIQNSNTALASSTTTPSTTTSTTTTPSSPVRSSTLILTFSPPLSNKQWIGREVELSQYIFKLSHNPLSFRMDDHFIQEMEMQRHERSGLIHPQHPYHFDQYYSLSQVNTLRMYDSHLNSMYSILVPKYVDDITFWKSYFYCVHRILYTDCIEELDEEICELYNKRRRQQIERELELQEYCNAIESDCKFILNLIEIENVNVNRMLKKEQELANRVIEEIEEGRKDGNEHVVNDDISTRSVSLNIQQEESNTSSFQQEESNGHVVEESSHQPSQVESTESSNSSTNTNTTTTEGNHSTMNTTIVDTSATTTAIIDTNTTTTTAIDTNTTTTTINTSTTTHSQSSPSTEEKTNHQKIEEKIREVIEIKKKLSLLSSEIITNETLIERIAQCNHCFMTAFTEYTKYKDLLKELPDSHPLYGTSVGGKLNSCSHSSFSPLLLNTNRTHPITTEFQRKKMVSILPARFHLSNWMLLYSTLEHGTSLRTLYRNTRHAEESILIIKTMDGQVLGAFNPVALNEFGNKYYGSGEILLFSFKNNTTLKVFRWSKLNEFFLRSNDYMICYGGDEVGRSALMIHEDLTSGSTNICLTFDNMEEGGLLEKVDKDTNHNTTAGTISESKPPGMVRSQSITTFSTEVEFEIYALEVWGFEDHTKKPLPKKVTSAAKSSFIDYAQY
ncbi:hypothetical protein C9374_012571 [Naegleria lovaniensis]|uniref:TLDc domain-containing protein n=1 Tax=Naegleria lovaniensis TaxID=51637 RepID=A0AA88KR29_NAELO|nr:uncharacterized protein C9374_012571 [Naegleria lovaniensis]KAG2392319.1 hypothetical protein C9374_012571 [Naegleria lovaniensis]